MYFIYCFILQKTQWQPTMIYYVQVNHQRVTDIKVLARQFVIFGENTEGLGDHQFVRDTRDNSLRGLISQSPYVKLLPDTFLQSINFSLYWCFILLNCIVVTGKYLNYSQFDMA